MNEKIIAGFGGGLILVSFLIIIFYPLFIEVNEKIPTSKGTPGFSQLQSLKDGAKNSFDNNTFVEEFRKLVGNASENMKNQITAGIDETFPNKTPKNSSKLVNASTNQD
jgi:hypothetical protein